MTGCCLPGTVDPCPGKSGTIQKMAPLPSPHRHHDGPASPPASKKGHRYVVAQIRDSQGTVPGIPHGWSGAGLGRTGRLRAGAARPEPARGAATRVALTAGDDHAGIVFEGLRLMKDEIARAIGEKPVIIKPNLVSSTSSSPPRRPGVSRASSSSSGRSASIATSRSPSRPPTGRPSTVSPTTGTCRWPGSTGPSSSILTGPPSRPSTRSIRTTCGRIRSGWPACSWTGATS